MSRSLFAMLSFVLLACQELPTPDPAPTASCLFGAQFSDIRQNPALILESEIWLRSVAALGGELAQA